jgi:capsid protein
MNWLDRAIGAVAPGAGLRRARQRQMTGLLARAYEGAKLGRRTEGWVAAGSGANAEIGPALGRLRDRSRDLVRNNPYAAKAVTALVSNMVGTGLMPRATAADPRSRRRPTGSGQPSPHLPMPTGSPTSPGSRR